MKTLKVEKVCLAGHETSNDVKDQASEVYSRDVQAKRLHSALGYQSPMEFETKLAQQAA